MQDVVPTTEPGGLFAGSPLPGISSTATNAPGKNLVVNMSWTISPTVVNEAAFNYSWGAINSNLTGITNSPAFLARLTGGLPYTDPYGRVPAVTYLGLHRSCRAESLRTSSGTSTRTFTTTFPKFWVITPFGPE